MNPQIKREMLIGAVLDINHGRYVEVVNADPELEAKMPENVEPHLGTMIESLGTLVTVDHEKMEEAKAAYLQALASLADESLHWIAATFGKDPFDRG